MFLQCSELDIGLQPLHVGRRERLEQAQVGKRFQRSAQPAVVHDIAFLIIIEIRVVAQLGICQPVEVELPHLPRTYLHLVHRLLGKAVDFGELVFGMESAELLAASQGGTCVCAADARYLLRLRGVGGI